ncbi:hypothetical protein [Micromonospora peucetia]|uniref:Lipoprotein n=1 Tax=Micromonospora peucetia TaxID=47871 RepID=A0A1C6VN71_9ACTN|nr:hypothetical protein [Micromonospora peucetia]SCL67715.1 hypothetical protein GA0070608_3572 [Micromonospora peucetia]
MRPTEKVNEPRRARGVAIIAALFLGVSISLSACAEPRSGSDPTAGSAEAQNSDERFWQTFRISGDEVEPYVPLGSMAQTADATVLARFGKVGKIRTLTAEGNDTVHYVSVDLAVTRELAGKGGLPSVVPLEFMVIPGRGQSIDDVAGEMSAALPKEEMVLFLRAKKGAGEAGLYRVVNSRGLWASTSRETLDTPLAEKPVKDEAQYKSDLAKVSTIPELANLVDNLR